MACNPSVTRLALCFIGTTAGGNYVEVRKIPEGTQEARIDLEAGPASIVWMPDGKQLLLSAVGTPGLKGQIFHLSYPRVEIRRVTNDLASYDQLGISQQGKQLFAVKEEQLEGLYIWSASDPASVRKLENVKSPWFFGWSGPQQVLFSSRFADLGIADLGTGNAKKLNTDQDHTYWTPAQCDEGTVVFSGGLKSERTGSTLNGGVWKMDAANGKLTQVTRGSSDYFPECTKDGKWIVYGDNIKFKIMKVPAEGGDPEKVSSGDTVYTPSVDLSPDGKLLLYVATEGPVGKQVSSVRLVSLDDWKVLRTILLEDRGIGFPLVRFMPDGKGLAYRVESGGVENIWQKPFNGDPAKQLTHFSEDRIRDFRWSPDGKRLGLVRYDTKQDVVVFQDTGAQ